jgi:hypothetical protein
MKYSKPDITNLGDAAAVICGSKRVFSGLDAPTPISPFAFLVAYDLDE